jgi:hypothetical protein
MLTATIAFLLAASCAARLPERHPQPPETERLLRDLRSEGCCPPGFAPSLEVAQRYRLRRLPPDSSYWASGFLSVAKSVRPSDVAKLGAAVGTQIDTLWTVHVPVQHLPALLSAEGVKTFELGKKAAPKAVRRK